ncbi:MAG: serine hydrolase [Sphingobium sp.]|uniref:serine hydrolase domain-containing protein n=1 Tax=Sphingobium sp. TaxID=1912891 RepID=UPI0029B26C70|nr:serine hydrolase [Sphingobium sp.]MDX3909879.1 serine hydrolase [Sphingobium sp.]
MKTKSALRASLALLPLALLASIVPGQSQSAGFYEVNADASVSESNLRGAIDAIFDADDMGDTRALLVMHDGKIVAERYGPGFGPDTKQLSWSLAKSVTAVLVGLMVSDGRLALDSPAPVPAWNQAGDPRGAITLRHLLTMSSGLDHAETADDAGGAIADADTPRMLFTDGARDMAAYAEAKPMAQHPGKHFNYSSATAVILSDILTRMLTSSNDPEVRRAAMMQFVEGRLKQPVGLSSLTPEFDARGTMIGGSIMHMTARDYAKFGEFLRNRGRANGRQILSQRWVKFMTTPSAQEPAYGGQLWLNRPSENNHLFPDTAPRSLFACLGHNGQYILVSPRQRLTIVRLGVSDREEGKSLKAAMGKLLELFPD